ncbi:Uu.00g041660.m01.CDS01 [Anthostomella pinea]|uniref:Uu.00g041660.m01.CDS01 n=1 Tax=Anthostomella pinea TaxID=933095 RepID=A0AAI8VAJ9_9PEZI|nr:Uu.00g041660.m01.CDS01 [Anthostomella pinea]
MVSLPTRYSDVSRYADELVAFLQEPLSVQITGGIHVNDAFISDAWDKLPAEWTQWWESLTSLRDAQDDLIKSLHKDPEARKVDLPGRPESLTRWLERIRNISLDRDQLVLPREMEHVELPRATISRIKVTKKLAEVQVAARFIQHTCRTNNIKRVIDIGSGQGYLATTLASVCGLRVLAVDGSAKQIDGSKAAARSAGLAEGKEITHLVRFVDGSGSLGSEIQAWAGGEPCLLTGLHACGSLSEHMVRLFTRVPCIARLTVVGCCYNHITPRSPSCPNGFPISQHMRRRNLALSASALVTGCQAPTNWVPNPDSRFVRKYWYRAVLEKMLYDKGISTAGARPVWGIRTGDLESFESYTKRAAGSLGLKMGSDITDEDIGLWNRLSPSTDVSICRSTRRQMSAYCLCLITR